LTPKTDEAVRSGTLPPPELNPLLNPILNKNLGRWAEVYFTNPPDKRDQAVVNLLRELETGATTAAELPKPPVQAHRPARSSESNADLVLCRECGFENEIQQKFCGDCGAPLQASPSEMSRDSRPLVPEYAGSERSETPLQRSQGNRLAQPQFGSILHLADPAPLTLGARSAQSDSEPEDAAVARAYAEPAPFKRSYRFSIGAALALIIGGLLYVAWRGGLSSPERGILPAPAPAVAAQPASSPEPAQVASPPSQSATSAPAPTTPAPLSDAAHSKNSLPSAQTKRSENPTAPAPSADGGEELATALGFLNGTGHQRDTAQAAQWLWKAVEKQNTTATVLLAGLYLHGDGVPKNCDQGRVLLDAAAIKGNKEAADLLRNLQAFGCE